jgi:hypothetical protein
MTLASQNGDTLIFTLNNILAQAYNYYKITVRYDSSYFNINDTIWHHAWIKSDVNEDTAYNYCKIYQVYSYSYDPNHKYSIPEGTVTKDLKEIQYHIDFENEGNDYAEKVTVIDTLDTRIPVYEFQMNGASHPYHVSLRGNIVTWTFDNINLLPKSQDSVKSKGYISFRAKVKGELRQGDSIVNRASIYFDYNSPIATNFAVIHVGEPNISVRPVISTKGNWSIFPNPAQSKINISNAGISNTFVIYNIQGKRMTDLKIAANSAKSLEISNWTPGIYIVTDSYGNAAKFVLQ